MPRRRSTLWFLLAAAVACSAPPRAPAAAAPPWVAIAPRLVEHVRVLSSDRFEGRAPGTRGEELTIAYLQDELRKLRLAPEVQPVPLVAIGSRASLAIDGKAWRSGEDFVAWSYGTSPDVHLERSELVFVGYGVVAPEHAWDDFKDVDLRGKTAVFLVGDPPVPDPKDPTRLDDATFRGRAMTYYGRWRYKYEIAAKKGAAAALIVHETGPAGYGWNVVAGGATHERYEIATAEARAAHVPIEGWIHESRARELFEDFDRAKASALDRAFRPAPIRAARADLEVRLTARELVSRNVVAKLPGSDPRLRDEHVMYSAHWDHFGKSAEGVFHGALDNASGVAWLLETARLYRELPRAPRRSIVFAAFTAEEQGLLGSKHYASQPHDRVVADINMDIMNPWGKTRAIVSVGDGETTMDEPLREEAAKQGRRVVPDPEPEKGYYFRSDHYELVKTGVPALSFLHPGAEWIGKPPDFGAKKRAEYVARMYHQPDDVIHDDWDLAGAAEDVALLFEVGRRVADADRPPAFKDRAAR
ncbi:MAG: M20/M25/M40 family metallo-hydrolase [Labilithrix sp.]|nr:M20/M25/M40 family metallo-hydrolase [Labilithrix sp.]MCW5813150.1 M20/M25/M40 family metallo-hydrolase [Labilithrix sp.]